MNHFRGFYIEKNGFLAVFPLFGKTQKWPFLLNSDRDRAPTRFWSFFGYPDDPTMFSLIWTKIKGTSLLERPLAVL